MSDKIDRAFAYLDAKLVRVRSCIEHYLEKSAGALNNATMLSIFRTTEDDVIKQFGLENNRTTHNNLRQYMLDVLLKDDDAVHH